MNISTVCGYVFGKIGNLFAKASKVCYSRVNKEIISNEQKHVQIININEKWTTCIENNHIWELDSEQYIDSQILKNGIFEPDSISWLKDIIKPGMTAFDVGANFGYYTIILNELVGEQGKVIAFEPSLFFYKRLCKHIDLNNCKQVTSLNFGLSNIDKTLELYRSGDTACLQWYDNRTKPISIEKSEVKTLDSIVEELNLESLDFIKVDIDGHEPFFIEGAEKTIKKYQPIIQMEFQELALLENNCDVESLASKLWDLGYSLYSEHSKKPLLSRTDFLIEAKNCAYSVNLFCFPNIGVLKDNG